MAGRGPGRPRQTSHEELQTLARKMFTERGYGNVSLAEIARAAGVSRTTLFSYFPAKRDLMSAEMNERLATQYAYLETNPSGTTLDILAAAIISGVDYPASDHDELAARFAIFQQSEELRAHISRHMNDLAEALVAFVGERAPDVDRRVIGDVAHALMAVASRGTADWMRGPATVSMNEFVSARVMPIAEVLRPLVD